MCVHKMPSRLQWENLAVGIQINPLSVGRASVYMGWAVEQKADPKNTHRSYIETSVPSRVHGGFGLIDSATHIGA